MRPSANPDHGFCAGRPERCMAMDSRLTSATFPSRSGQTSPRRVSASISPRSMASAKRAAVKVFVIEPISNSVCSSAPVPAKATSSPSTRAAAMCCQCLPPRACSTSAMSSASPVGAPWKPRGHGVSAARATAVSAATASATDRRRGDRAGGSEVRLCIVPPGDPAGWWSPRFSGSRQCVPMRTSVSSGMTRELGTLQCPRRALASQPAPARACTWW